MDIDDKIKEIDNQYKNKPSQWSSFSFPSSTTQIPINNLNNISSSVTTHLVNPYAPDNFVSADQDIMQVNKQLKAISEKAWMPSGWSNFMMNVSNRTIEDYKNPLKSGLLYPAMDAGDLIVGTVQGAMKVLNKIDTIFQKGFSKGVVPVVVMPVWQVAGFIDLMKHDNWDLSSVLGNMEYSSIGAAKQMNEILSRLDPNDPQFIQLLGSPQDAQKALEEAYTGQHSQVYKDAMIVATTISMLGASAQIETQGKMAGTLKHVTQGMMDFLSDPFVLFVGSLSTMKAMPPIMKKQITPEMVNNAKTTLGIEDMSGIDTKGIIDMAQSKMQALSKTPMDEILLTNKVNQIRNDSAILMNQLPNPTVSEILSNTKNPIRIAWDLYLKAKRTPVLGTDIPVKYPFNISLAAQGVREADQALATSVDQLRAIQQSFNLSDTYLDMQARIATGKGISLTERIKSGWTVNNLDKEGINKLLDRLEEIAFENSDDFVKGIPHLWTVEEKIELAKRLPDYNKLANGTTLQKLQEVVKSIKYGFNMKDISPELYFPAQSANIQLSQRNSQAVAQLNYIFTDNGIQEGDHLSKIIYHATEQSNYAKYLQGLYSNGTITADEFNTANKVVPLYKDWYASFIPDIQALTQKYSIPFKIETPYAPRIMIQELERQLNMQKTTAKYLAKLTAWNLSDNMSDMSIPTNLQMRTGRLEPIDDAITAAQRYYRSVNKFLSMKDFDDYAVNLVQDLPPNLQSLAVKYINVMRGVPTDNQTIQALTTMISKYEYGKYVMFNLTTALKNASQTNHDIASLYDMANYSRAIENLNTINAQQIIQEMGVLNVNIQRGTVVGNLNNWGKLEQTGYGAWEFFQKNNYRISGLSHYYDGIEQGMTHSQAIQFGLSKAIESQFAYNRAGMSAIDIMAPDIGRMFLFKKWGLAQAQMLYDWWQAGDKLSVVRFFMDWEVLSKYTEKYLGVSIGGATGMISNMWSRGPLVPIIDEVKRIQKQSATQRQKTAPFTLQFVNSYSSRILNTLLEMKDIHETGKVLDNNGLPMFETTMGEAVRNLIWSSSQRQELWDEINRISTLDTKITEKYNKAWKPFYMMMNAKTPQLRLKYYNDFIAVCKKLGIEIGIDITPQMMRIRALQSQSILLERFIKSLSQEVKRNILQGNY